MEAVICTLFESHYHYGVAALINSLFKQGYRGAIYAGYKGNLPKWVFTLKKVESGQPANVDSFEVANDLTLHFISLCTGHHLTNYKPDFMLELMTGLAKEAKGIFYFDPDIVVTDTWSSFLDWINCGVALCEDVNSPLSEFHPRRVAWRNYYQTHDIALKFKNNIYVNGGFVGLKREHLTFLRTWKSLQEKMAIYIGGLNFSAFPGNTIAKNEQNSFSPFGRTDQDALNAAVEAWEGYVSYVGQEAMGFKAGQSLLPHAVGQPKPWHWKPIQQAIIGLPPRLVDREYWKSVNGPVRSQSKQKIILRNVNIGLAAFISRFYRKNGASI